MKTQLQKAVFDGTFMIIGLLIGFFVYLLFYPNDIPNSLYGWFGLSLICLPVGYLLRFVLFKAGLRKSF